MNVGDVGSEKEDGGADALGISPTLALHLYKSRS